MRVKNLKIKNFRGLGDVSLNDLDPHVNLFVGVNGAGKSSVLDALSILLSWFIARMQNMRGRGQSINMDDIKQDSKEGCSMQLETTSGEIWSLYRGTEWKNTEKSSLAALSMMVNKLRERMKDDKQASVPVIAHYKVNRSVLKIPLRIRKNKRYPNSDEIYKNSLEGSASFHDFFAWYREQEDIENETIRDDSAYRDRGLETIRRAMLSIFPEYSDMRVKRHPQALTIKKGSKTLKLNQLSDGEKCYIALVCDLTRRLVVATPSGDPLLNEGIVLIDEVDLHLHPQWQLEVVSKLVKTFPNCQFFLTSHSPIVASDIQGKVYVLKDGTIQGDKELTTYGRTSQEILSLAFDVSNARSTHVQDLIDRTYEAIRNEDFASYDRHMGELSRILGEDDKEVLYLRLEKMRKERTSADRRSDR